MQWVPEALSAGKAAGAWNWPLPYKVNCTRSYTAIPPIRLYGVERGNFTFSTVTVRQKQQYFETSTAAEGATEKLPGGNNFW